MEPKTVKKKFMNTLLIILGTVCVFMGFIGIFIPVLPTTPFLLLAAYLYGRSSERFLNWLVTNRLFGRYIDNYRSGRGILLIHKLVSITFLWLTILISIIFFVDSLWMKAGLLFIALGVTIHLVRVKTMRVGSSKTKQEKSGIIDPGD